MADKKQNILLALIILVVALFGFSRLKSDYRWGGWAIGDAQNLNAAIHFADEGFKKHYFLTYYHPGYLGERYGTETELGYYTHYPPLSALLNGFVIKLWGDELWKLRSVSIAFSTAWLVFFYTLIGSMLNKKMALISTALIGTSAGYLDYMDGLAPYTYSEFYVYGALLLFAVSLRHGGMSGILLRLASWLLVFLESFNSFDYIFFMIIFMIGYVLLFESERKRSFLNPKEKRCKVLT